MRQKPGTDKAAQKAKATAAKQKVTQIRTLVNRLVTNVQDKDANLRGIRVRFENLAGTTGWGSSPSFAANQFNQLSKQYGIKNGMSLFDFLEFDVNALLDAGGDDWKKYMAGKDGSKLGSAIDIRGLDKATAAKDAGQPQDKIHAHHIVMRNGPAWSQQAKDDVTASKEILKRVFKITDPDTAWQNLVWAPNFGGANHNPNYAKAVRYWLEKAEPDGKTFVLEALRKLGERFNKNDPFANGR